MPDRYWVSGSGTWNSTNTANWSTTSGGAGGASVPTSADDVFFDGNSDSGSPFTVTIGTGAVCKTFDANTGTPLDQTMTLAGTAQWDVYGSLIYPSANLTRTYTGNIFLLAASGSFVITTNGVNPTGSTDVQGALRINGGADYTLGSALTVGGTTGCFRVANGSFNTANFNITFGIFRAAGTTTKTITFGSSIVTTTSTTFTIDQTAESSTTINAGTSTLVFSNASPVFFAGGFVYYNVEFTSTALTTLVILGANTFNNLTFASRAAAGFGACSLAADQTITGTLSVQSGNTDPTRRILFRSDTPGTQRTITAANIDFGSGIDFQDIVAAGAASPFDVSALQGGDCKGNSNITFPAAKTVYRIGTGNFSATQWASTSGGTPAADQFPLAQDTMVFDANTTTGTHTINANYQLGTLDMTNSTTVTLVCSLNPVFYGDYTLSNAVTPSGASAIVFAGRNTQTITSSGRTFTNSIVIDSLGGTVVLADAFITNRPVADAITLTRGTLDLNNQTATCFGFNSSNSNIRAIAFNNGTLVCQGNFTATTGTNLTTSGTGTISMTSASSKTFAGGGRTYPTLEQAGAGTLTITGANTFDDITNTNPTASQITFPASTITSVKRLRLNGSSGNLVSMRSSSSGTAYTIRAV
jgi:hypothetical protein